MVSSDIEENGVRLKLTVVDTPGFGDFVNNDEWYANRLNPMRMRISRVLQLETYP
jgi:septin 7